MKTAFSVNTYDSDGDVIDERILLHCDGNLILNFKDVEELESFAEQVKRVAKEIRENY